MFWKRRVRLSHGKILVIIVNMIRFFPSSESLFCSYQRNAAFSGMPEKVYLYLEECPAIRPCIFWALRLQAPVPLQHQGPSALQPHTFLSGPRGQIREISPEDLGTWSLPRRRSHCHRVGQSCALQVNQDAFQLPPALQLGQVHFSQVAVTAALPMCIFISSPK